MLVDQCNQYRQQRQRYHDAWAACVAAYAKSLSHVVRTFEALTLAKPTSVVTQQVLEVPGQAFGALATEHMLELAVAALLPLTQRLPS